MTRMTHVTRMARTVARMARWLADFADPESLVKPRLPGFSGSSLRAETSFTRLFR